MGAGGFVGALEFCGETVLGLDICVFSYSQNLPRPAATLAWLLSSGAWTGNRYP